MDQLDEENLEIAWKYPGIPWVFGLGTLALAIWFFNEGAWWQLVMALIFFMLAAMGLKQAVMVTIAKVVWRQRRKQTQDDQE